MAPMSKEQRERLEDLFDSAASLFKALAHPMRMKLLCGLLHNPCTQTQISRILGIPQSSLAQHLAVLRREGVVRGRREHGAEVILEVVDERVVQVFHFIIEEDPRAMDIDWESLCPASEMK